MNISLSKGVPVLPSQEDGIILSGNSLAIQVSDSVNTLIITIRRRNYLKDNKLSNIRVAKRTSGGKVKVLKGNREGLQLINIETRGPFMKILRSIFAQKERKR